MDVTREELDATEAELLEQIALLDYTDKIKNRAYNLIRRRFRLERTILWIKQKIERDKR